MIKIFPETKIYILSPSDYMTGGVECLHQLAGKLKKLGYLSFVVYLPRVKEALKRYETYKIDISYNIEDNDKNLLIVPETWTEELKKYRKIRKSIWWLSVDNAKRSITLPIGKINKRIPFFKDKFPVLYDFLKDKYMKLNKKGRISFNFENNDVYHLVQSYYAKNFLLDKGVKNVDILNDYLDSSHLKKRFNEKEDIIVYNPKKGKEITKEIIKDSNGLKYLPLENMDSEGVATALSKSKVYIDFGHHPGRDKIPREAVINNCCVIVGKNGSARFYEDIPINEEYKFETKQLDTEKVIIKIRECLTNYKKKIRDFQKYKKVVFSDEKNMEKNIKKIFIR